MLALPEAEIGHHLQHPATFLESAHERHHRPHVIHAHRLADFFQGPAFQFETIPEPVRDIPRGAAEAEHGVLLMRLIPLAPDEVGVFVRLEIGQPHDHRMGGEGGGDRADALGKPVHVKGDGVRVAAHEAVDPPPGVMVLAVVLEQRLGVHANHAVDDELEPGQADTMMGQHAEVETAVGIGDVHHDLDRRFWH